MKLDDAEPPLGGVTVAGVNSPESDGIMKMYVRFTAALKPSSEAMVTVTFPLFGPYTGS